MFINSKNGGTRGHSLPQERMVIILKGGVEVYFIGQKSILMPGHGYYFRPP